MRLMTTCRTARLDDNRPCTLKNSLLRALTVSVLLIIGVLAVATGFVSESAYRQAAIEAQTRAVTRILGVASDAALTRLETNSAQLAAAAGKALADSLN